MFSHLRLWIDENHDGVSQPNELHALPALGVYSIGLKYREDWYVDQYGNQFRYRGVLNPDPADGKSKDGRWTYDVLFAGAKNQAGGPVATARSLSSPFQRQGQWQLLLARGAYRHGVLVEDLAFVSLQATATRCRPRPRRDDLEGGAR